MKGKVIEAAVAAAIEQLEKTGALVPGVDTSPLRVAIKLQTVCKYAENTLRQSAAVRKFCNRLNTPAPGANPAQKVETEQTDNLLKVTGEGFGTPEELLQRAGVDLTKWRVTKLRTGTHQMGYKNAIGEAEKIPLFNYSIELAPVDKNAFDYQKARDFVIQEMKQHAPAYKTLKRVAPVGSHLLVVDPADSHFGKYAAALETGENYNLETARARVLEGVAGLIAAAAGYNIGRVLLVVGNDVLHVDNTTATTTGGTFQNTDGLWFEMFQTAKRTFVEVIEMLIPIADVDIVFNPSNHDYASGYMLVDSLASWFKDCQNVTFQASTAHRKYYAFGNSLIGTTHGDGAKPLDLPQLMAQESPELWAKTKYRYFYTHHVHHADRLRFRETKDYIGVTVESVRSPSASDSWHAKKGYTGVPKAVGGFIHSETKGQVARLTYVF